MNSARAARATLAAAIAALLAGAFLVIAGNIAPAVPAPVAAPAPLPALFVAPAAAPRSSMAATTTTTTAKPTTTKAKPKTTASTKPGCGPDGWRANAECPGQGPTGEGPCLDDGTVACDGTELGPYYDYGSSQDAQSPGDAALAACVEQTGMTRKECVADAAAGNAS